MADLAIDVAGAPLPATWVDENPETRAAIADALPLSGPATRWGDELYFPVPVECPAEEARQEVPVGAVAYWPQGSALCLFWGPTPASPGAYPRAAAPVNAVAQVADVSSIADRESGVQVTVERA